MKTPNFIQKNKTIEKRAFFLVFSLIGKDPTGSAKKTHRPPA
jgi:hypothetical protein